MKVNKFLLLRILYRYIYFYRFIKSRSFHLKDTKKSVTYEILPFKDI